MCFLISETKHKALYWLVLFCLRTLNRECCTKSRITLSLLLKDFALKRDWVAFYSCTEELYQYLKHFCHLLNILGKFLFADQTISYIHRALLKRTKWNHCWNRLNSSLWAQSYSHRFKIQCPWILLAVWNDLFLCRIQCKRLLLGNYFSLMRVRLRQWWEFPFHWCMV